VRLCGDRVRCRSDLPLTTSCIYLWGVRDYLDDLRSASVCFHRPPDRVGLSDLSGLSSVCGFCGI